MSDYFDIYCRTCSAKGNVFQWNHGGRQISQVCQDLPVLRKIGIAIQELGSGIEFELLYNGDPISLILSFAVSHAGHDVAARSEYGGFHDRCPRRWTCDGCDSSHPCGKPPGHLDPCGRQILEATA